jgi:cystathionine beta-lyase/cystathionine gamma-synthase
MDASAKEGPRPESRLSTICVHAGTHLDADSGGVCTPVVTSSAYAYPHPEGGNVYPRYFNTVNQTAVARKVAALEQGEEAMVFASGMAAISTSLFSLLGPGDEALFQADLYGGTLRLLAADLARFGVEARFGKSTTDILAAITGKTKVIYLESPSNPLLRCVDLKRIADAARPRGIATLIDNTFATPINQNPLALGIDVVIHSATKYLNGHSDLNAGVVVSSGPLIRKLRDTAINFGGVLDSLACYQLERGMKTLALRVRQHNENAGRLARFLQDHPSVARVHYPGLPEHPDHALAARQMRGFGGMLAFELRQPEKVDLLLSRLRLARKALSLGGVETLVCVPSRTSHASLSPAERRGLGIEDGLIRISTGIEDAEDLLADFASAMEP